MALVSESVTTLNYILLECSINSIRKKPTIKVVIFNPQKDIGSRDCAEVANIISSRLDILDPFEEHYDLVVESPGLEREIKNPQEYSYFLEKEFKIFPKIEENFYLQDGFFIGQLKEINDKELCFLSNKKMITIPLDSIQKAKLHCNFSKILKENKKK